MFLTFETVENGKSRFGCIHPDQVKAAYSNERGEIVLETNDGEKVFPRTPHNLEQARAISGPVQFSKAFPEPPPLAGQVPLTPSGVPAQATTQHDPHPDQNAFFQASRSPAGPGHGPDDIDPGDLARFHGVGASERGVSADVRTTPLTNSQKAEAAERQRQEAAQRQRESQKAKAGDQAKGAQEKGEAQAGQTAQTAQKKSADQGQAADQGKAGQDQAHPGETLGEKRQREFEERNREAEERRRQAASERKHE